MNEITLFVNLYYIDKKVDGNFFVQFSENGSKFKSFMIFSHLYKSSVLKFAVFPGMHTDRIMWYGKLF